MDFAAADAPARINEWVSENTAGKIPHMVDVLERLTLLVALKCDLLQGLVETAISA
jgi:serine protease inhibitor